LRVADYNTRRVAVGAGKVRPICAILWEDEDIQVFKESMQVEKLQGMATVRK